MALSNGNILFGWGVELVEFLTLWPPSHGELVAHECRRNLFRLLCQQFATISLRCSLFMRALPVRRGTMKAALIPFVFVAFTSAWATTPSLPPIPSSCGPKDAGFNVKLDKSQHSLTQPDAGQARIYFIREEYDVVSGSAIMFGIDGAWVGANHGTSYFSVSVDPGERHICVATQYRDREGEQLTVVLAHLQVEAGKTYFYRTRDYRYLQIDPIDSDEGKYLLTFFPLSVSSPKK